MAEIEGKAELSKLFLSLEEAGKRLAETARASDEALKRLEAFTEPNDYQERLDDLKRKANLA